MPVTLRSPRPETSSLRRQARLNPGQSAGRERYESLGQSPSQEESIKSRSYQPAFGCGQRTPFDSFPRRSSRAWAEGRWGIEEYEALTCPCFNAVGMCKHAARKKYAPERCRLTAAASRDISHSEADYGCCIKTDLCLSTLWPRPYSEPY